MCHNAWIVLPVTAGCCCSAASPAAAAAVVVNLRPWHNIISVFVMGCVCFYPRFSLFAFLLWRSVVSLRRLLMHVRVFPRNIFVRVSPAQTVQYMGRNREGLNKT